MPNATYLGMTPDFGYSTQTTVDQIMYFDPYRLPSIENSTEGLIGHVFMSRPSLNLGGTNVEFLRKNSKTAAFFSDPVARAALWSISTKSPCRWLPLVYKKAKSYSVNDMEIKAAEKGGTYYGHTIRYGIHSEESKFGNTVSIDFRNDKDHSILWMIYQWMCYIYLVSAERNFQPNLYHQYHGILDYAASIYYIVTDRTGKFIKYWEKLVGVFPIKAPFSIFSWNDDIFTQDSISIDFQYSFRSDPMDYDVLVDFMAVSGLLSEDSIDVPSRSQVAPLGGDGVGGATEFVRKDAMMKVPMIYEIRKSDRSKQTFCLGWSNTSSYGSGNYFTETGNTEYIKCTLPKTEQATPY